MRASTGHDDVNAVLDLLAEGVSTSLGDNLVGFYLTGSLTYGDFDRGSSDIDYLVAMRREISTDERTSLKRLHAGISSQFRQWAERIEGTYVTLSMLQQHQPPAQGRPYVNQGAFWEPDPPYGNEWLLNLFVLERCGVALVGPEPTSLIRPVAIADVRAASNRDLFEERLPTVGDLASYEDPHIQAYTVLTICRILHRNARDEVVSKRGAAEWVMERYGKQWRPLVTRSLHWQHGQPLARPEEVTAFIRIAANEIGKVNLQDAIDSGK